MTPIITPILIETIEDSDVLGFVPWALGKESLLRERARLSGLTAGPARPLK